MGEEKNDRALIINAQTTGEGSLLDFNVTLFQNQILANYPLPNILDVLDNSLEVTCRIVRAGNEDVVGSAVRDWGIDGRN